MQIYFSLIVKEFYNISIITLEISFLMESIATREREEAMWNLSALPKGTIVAGYSLA